MKSPRWLRPHTIKVMNILGEENLEETTSTVTVQHVKVSKTKARTYGQTGASNSDTILITIDVNDYKADKILVSPSEFKTPDKQFTFRTGDRIEVHGDIYEITNVNILNPLRNTPEFIEVTCE